MEVVSNILRSRYFFYLVLCVNLVLLCVTKFYPSMDGPAHLYNSNILTQLINGNSFLSDFYSINNLPIPNWTSQFVLLVFHSFLPAWIAEKMLLILYVSGMAFSFRYLLKILNPENSYLSILIFPFVFSFLFHLGFYNFCISFILLFTTLGYWLRFYETAKPLNYVVLFLLMTISYFSNVLIFGFLGLTIGSYILYFTYINFKINKKKTAGYGIRQLSVLLLVSLPSLIFVYMFLDEIKFFQSSKSYPFDELIKWILDARPLIVYSYSGEEMITQQYLYVLLFLLFVSFIKHKKKEKINIKPSFGKANIIAIPLILSLILLFLVPDGSGAGMMSDRYCLLVIIFLLVLAVSRTKESKFSSFIIPIILILHFVLMFKHLNKSIRFLDANAITINNTAKYIDENSIVLPINLSDHWLELHFSNYIGVDKSLVVLENYEASVGWFPVKWNVRKMPNILLSEKKSISKITWINNSESPDKKQIGYVLLFGNQSKLDDSRWDELKQELSNNFRIKYKSENSYVVLYEKINNI